MSKNITKILGMFSKMFFRLYRWFDKKYSDRRIKEIFPKYE